MVTTLLNNLLYSKENEGGPLNDSGSPNITEQQQQQKLKMQGQRQHIVSLLQASIQCVQQGTCHPVLYQTMGALHQYTAICGGISMTLPITMMQQQQESTYSRPAFIIPKNKMNYDAVQHPGNDRNENESNTKSKSAEEDQEDFLAYGWIEQLSSGLVSSVSTTVAWEPVLVLLTQKEQDDEPFLWVTREILTSSFTEEQLDENKDIDDAIKHSCATELETLRSIPLWRRLRSCRYQDFYGDHRVILLLKRYNKYSSDTEIGRAHV